MIGNTKFLVNNRDSHIVRRANYHAGSGIWRHDVDQIGLLFFQKLAALRVVAIGHRGQNRLRAAA
jgi:hypothetical protein